MERQRWEESEKRREEKKREDQRREKARRKKMQVREKVEKPRNTAFFHWFVALEVRKVASLKRRVRSRRGKCEMKKCTPLWREAHFEVKMHHTSRSEHFSKLRCGKSVRSCGAKHISYYYYYYYYNYNYYYYYYYSYHYHHHHHHHYYILLQILQTQIEMHIYYATLL